jgi:hypothetical protein
VIEDGRLERVPLDGAVGVRLLDGEQRPVTGGPDSGKVIPIFRVFPPLLEPLQAPTTMTAAASATPTRANFM